jgi:MFS family permease
VFMAGSILCGLSGSLEGFVAARFFQGIGGAMMVPVGRIVILRSVAKSELVQALSYLTMPALLGPVIGPPLGGLITTYLHWRWIFFINIPISIVGIVLATRHIENLREQSVPRLDIVGFVLSAAGLSLLMLGLSTAGRHMVSGTVSALCVLVGLACVLGYWAHARRTPQPLLDLKLFRVRTFRTGVLGGSLFRIGIGSVPFLLPMMLQLGFGLTPFRSGLLTCASAAGALFMKTIARKILKAFGFRPVLSVNVVLSCASIAVMGLFTASTPHPVVLAVLLAGGCFRSLQFTSLNAISYADIRNEDISQATSIASVVQQLAVGMGVTVGAFLLQISNAVQGHAQIVAADFGPAFALIALIGVISIRSSLSLPRDAGEEIAGRR